MVGGDEVCDESVDDGKLRPTHVAAPFEECLVFGLRIESKQSPVEHLNLRFELLVLLLHHNEFIKTYKRESSKDCLEADTRTPMADDIKDFETENLISTFKFRLTEWTLR